MADWIEATDESFVRLMVVSTCVEKTRNPTRVLPLSMSNLLTSCDRNDFVSSKSDTPTLPESPSTKIMSKAQSTGDGAAKEFYANVNAILRIVSFILAILASWWRSIVVRAPVLVSELSLSCARLTAGCVSTLWVKRPLSVNRHGQLSQPSFRGRLNK